MEANELRDLGRQIARDIAAGLMQATAAGAAEFCREMRNAREDAEADGLLAAGERIEQAKSELQAQIAKASGLKKLGLQKRLRQVEVAEAEMCRMVEGETLAIEHQPAEPAADADVVRVPSHTRKKPSRNGTPQNGQPVEN